MDERQRITQMVDDFAARMKEKLLEKADAGWSGWSQEDYRPTLEGRLILHAVQGIQGDPYQWIDVANFAAFLDYQTARERDQ